jgi:hypothetical protein
MTSMVLLLLFQSLGTVQLEPDVRNTILSAVTVTAAVQVPEPPVPETESVYVVVTVGETVVEPPAVETLPMLWSMEALVASEVVHVRRVVAPCGMLDGDAESVQVAGGTYGSYVMTMSPMAPRPPPPSAVQAEPPP